MALDHRLADNTVLALVKLIRDLHERFSAGGFPIYGSALYGDGDTHTLREEVKRLMEATSHV